MKKEVQIFLARKKDTGEIVNISQVDRGLDCNCVCINCGKPLVAKKGEHNQDHFSHVFHSDCNSETVLHKLAKEILLKNTGMQLPDGKGWFGYNEVAEEQWLGNTRPDIVLKGNAKTIHIEIAVTSFIDEYKLSKIKLACYNTIEIDLSGVDHTIGEKELEHILIEELDNKEIIYWSENSLTTTDSEGNSWLLPLLAAVGLLWAGNQFRKWLKKK